MSGQAVGRVTVPAQRTLGTGSSTPVGGPSLVTGIEDPEPWLGRQPAVSAVLALGLAEGRRLLRHPVVVLTALWVLVVLARPLGGPYNGYSALTGLVAFVLGPGTYVAGYLLATSASRSGATEWIAAVPLSARARTAGQLLGVAAPALLSVLLVGVVAVNVAVTDLTLRATPSVAELASTPLCVLGGGLLGVMTARWSRWPGTPALVLVALVAFHVWIGEHQQSLQYLGAYVDFPRWVAAGWIGLHPGSPEWHVVYLLALDGMAAVGALVATPGRRLPLLALGAALTALAAVAGVAQLP